MEEKENKNFILRVREWYIGYYTGTIEEMCSALNKLTVEVTRITDIEPVEDLGVTYNRVINTKMKAVGRDTTAQEAFVAEYEQLVKKYSTDKKQCAPRFAVGELEYFFQERPVETDAIDVLIADDTTFRSSYFDKASNTIVYILSQRTFEPCSEISKDCLYETLWNYVHVSIVNN